MELELMETIGANNKGFDTKQKKHKHMDNILEVDKFVYEAVKNGNKNAAAMHKCDGRIYISTAYEGNIRNFCIQEN